MPQALIAGYIPGESYGLLGPQMAATIISEYTPCECIVIAATRDDDKVSIKKTLSDYFGTEQPIIGFSSLSGNPALFSLAKELKDEGAITILAGPQAEPDFIGETAWQKYPHRFKGYAENFNFALQGPAEQIVAYLQNPQSMQKLNSPGILYRSCNDQIIRNNVKKWEKKFLNKVNWDNIFRVTDLGLHPHRITTGQVLQQIGCPYAAKSKWIAIDYPTALDEETTKNIRLQLKGCSFCDVAVDKGFYGTLNLETVMTQIDRLPAAEDGRKIPFELINENPLPVLPRLLKEIQAGQIDITRINLTLRADYLLRGSQSLQKALQIAYDMKIRIVLASVGFESFDDRIMRNLNKGLTVVANLKAIEMMRRLKSEYPEQLYYLRKEGGNHGFIHPTPWDTPQTDADIGRVISRHGLSTDILPDHSTPLIIHHASALGEWIRHLEHETGLVYPRQNTWIAWWEKPYALEM
jgi:hypothetical protein